MALGSEAAIAIVIKARDEAAKVIDGVEQKAGGLGKTLGSVAKIGAGVALGAGITEGARFLTDAAQAAAEDAQATARLQQAVKNLGGDYNSTIASVDKAIASGQKLGFTDDDVRDSYIKLASATGDSDEALRRQQLAMDLARGANIPLSQASTLLGKVTAENVEVFKRMGITIGEGASEADAFAAIQAKFGGQSEVFAKSTAGQFEITKQQMGELQEQIGTALLPVMTILGGVLVNNVIPAVTSLLNVMTANPALFATVAAVIGGVLVAAFTAWAVSAGAAAVATIAAAAPVLAVVAAVGLLAAGIVLLVTHWDEITAKFPALGVASDAVGAALRALADWITGSFVPAVQAIATAITDAVTMAVGFVKDHWGEIQAFIEPAMQILATMIQTYWENIRIVFETVFGVIQGLLDVFIGIFTGDWDRAWQGVQQIAQSVWDGITGIIQNSVDGILSILGTLMDIGVSLVRGLLDGAASVLGDLVNWFFALPGQIVSQIPNPLQVLYSIGTQIVQGLINGIKGMIGGLVGAVGDAIGAIPAAAKKILGIFSPSKVMQEVGEQTMQGMIVGVVNKKDPLLRTFGEIFEAIAPQIRLSNDSIDDAIDDLGQLMHDAAVVDIHDPLLRTFGEIFDQIAPIIHEHGPSTEDAMRDMGALMQDFAEATGVATGNALADGFESTKGAVVGAVNDVGNAAVAAAHAAAVKVAAEFKKMSAAAAAPGPAANPAVTGPLTQAQIDYIDYMNRTQGSVPALAGGGIVRARPGGMLVNVGEGKYDEAIMPLDGKHGMGSTVYVSGDYQQVFPNVRNADDFMRTVDWGAA